ncbi:UDP-N-acetyl-D-mannosamine dehydrogenase [compost metagenome]
MAVADFLQANPEKTARDVSIACFGLAFKADIDDLRESPAVSIALDLSKLHTGPVLAVEPNIEKLPDTLAGQLELVSIETALTEANIIVLLVDHKEFTASKEQLISHDRIIDTQGIIVF